MKQGKRRILLAVTGLTPQVVTETLYALAINQKKDRFVPTEVHLITTSKGAQHAKLNLLSDSPGWFHRLRKDYRLPPIDFTDKNIHIITNANGEELDDIRNAEDNELAADLITDLIRDFTQDENSALHVSLAGGRKTMGFYLGYALSIFGRPQDRLSHVLVSEPFEAHPDFYYPTPYQHIIHSRGKDSIAFDCQTTEVVLANIPFVSLRDQLPTSFTNNRTPFSEVVVAANRSLQGAHLEIQFAMSKKDRWVRADDQLVPIADTPFYLLLWLAKRKLDERPPVDFGSQREVDDFLKSTANTFGPLAPHFLRMETAIKQCHGDSKSLRGYFQGMLNKLKTAFVDVLGETAAKRYLVEKISHPKGSAYQLNLDPLTVRINY